MELNVEFARDRSNLSIDNIADLMGLPSKWTLYKWLESGRMPANLIRPFEHACGATYMTQYIAGSAHKLLIDIPSGKPAKDGDLLALQTDFNDALNLLASFYKGDASADDTLSALTATLTQIAGHRANVSQALTPELGLFEEAR